jgi:hypothetical protein
VIEPLTLVFRDAFTVLFRPCTPSFPDEVGHAAQNCTANAEPVANDSAIFIRSQIERRR